MSQVVVLEDRAGSKDTGRHSEALRCTGLTLKVCQTLLLMCQWETLEVTLLGARWAHCVLTFCRGPAMTQFVP